MNGLLHPCLMYTVLVVEMISIRGSDALSRPDNSTSATEFVTSPSNVTVPEGELAIMKCKVGSPAQKCRWYYLQEGLNFYDRRHEPLLVKDFMPGKGHDCSIKFTKVNKVQEGQWLCQVLQIHSTKFIMSQPVHLIVLSASSSQTQTSDDAPRQGRRDQLDDFNQEEDDTPTLSRPLVVEFEVSEDERVQNVAEGNTTIIKCAVNTTINKCSWYMSTGAILAYENGTKKINMAHQQSNNYHIEDNLANGRCSLRVVEVQAKDEGDWRCVVYTGPSHFEQRLLGPWIHLHILEADGSYRSHDSTPLIAMESNNATFIIIVLVATSGILFTIVIMLFMCLYHRLRNDDPLKKNIHTNLEITDSCSDIPKKSFPPQEDFLFDKGQEAWTNRKMQVDFVDLDHYSRYLDMSVVGSATDRYVLMPGSSIRSSSSSDTTATSASTLPIDQARSYSFNNNMNESLTNLPNVFDNPSYHHDGSTQHIGRPLIPRPDSLYSSYHLYEEIKEKVTNKDIMDTIQEVKTPESPTYTNTTEDVEGYMIPKKQTNIQSSDAIANLSNHVTPKAYSFPFLPTAQDSSFPEKTNLTSQLMNVPQNLEIISPVPDMGKVVPTMTRTAPPYSCISQNGLVPIMQTQLQSVLTPGYSRVGQANNHPLENYDIPRSHHNHLDEGYDIPRPHPVSVAVLAVTSTTQGISTDVSGTVV